MITNASIRFYELVHDYKYNTNVGIEEQRIALRHEIEHIARGDFYRLEVPLEMIESMEI